MPAAVLSEDQKKVLDAVNKATPHATLGGLCAVLRRAPHNVQRTLDALIRRGFVMPVELVPEGEAFIATVKGKQRG